jgi:hypothetical protein
VPGDQRVAVFALAQQGRGIMKLWILRPVNEYSSPWSPWYDKAFGFVARAEDELAARELANSRSGDEGSAWLDSEFSTCTELTEQGDSGVIMIDFHYA